MMEKKEHEELIRKYNGILRNELERLQRINEKLEKCNDIVKEQEIRNNALTMSEIVKALTRVLPLL